MYHYPYVIPYVREQTAFSHHYKHTCITRAELELRNQFRKLWEQHVEWTRMTIISLAENLKDVDLVTKRLLRNPSDMGVIFKTFYGEAIAAKFIELFTAHLVIAVQLVKAAKAGNTKAAEDAEKRWYANAVELAVFFNSINPYWPKEAMRNMLFEHLRLTKSQAVFRIQKNYAADIATFDKIEDQALQMADEFSRGIVQQFPSVFY